MLRERLVDLEAVVAIARHGSFRAAAQELEISPTALSHAIASLEARLGVRLFDRTTRRVTLTSAGDELVVGIKPALGVIRDAMESVNRERDAAAGMLRINSSLNAARQVLAPVIFEFLRLFPDMKVDLVADDRLIDIVANGFDAAVRLGDTIPADMIAVPLGSEQRFVVVGRTALFRPA